MKRKGIPKKRIGPESGSRERSIRMRQYKGVGRALNAAQRSAPGYKSVSLCGTGPVMVELCHGIIEGKKENKYLKEVMRRRRQN